jgi:biopolymer transport protein ExbB
MESIFIKGGPVMWPLLLCSLISVTIIIERTLFWLREMANSRKSCLEEILRKAEEGNFQGALEMTEGNEDTSIRVLSAGLENGNFGIKESIEIAASGEIERMGRGMTVLDTIITLAPLLGILGTVMGIIESFDMLGRAGIQNPTAVSGGIAQALITTAAGLIVAIVSLIPFNIFISKVRKMSAKLEKAATRLEMAYRKYGEDGDALRKRV